MEAAETHSYSVISVQSVIPTGQQADVVDNVQDATRQETHCEYDENQSADPDKWSPVTTRLT